MNIFFGNKSSNIVCFFLHGWTSSPNESFQYLKTYLNKDYYWIFIKAPIKGNQWFEYGSQKENVSGKNLQNLIDKYNLNYRYKHQIYSTCDYIDSFVRKYSERSVYFMGTSQGATILFHYLHHSFTDNIKGVWFHNIAGIYIDLLKYRNIFFENFVQMQDSYFTRQDKHSTFDVFSIQSMNRIFVDKNVVFYNTRSDYVIPENVTSSMFECLSSVYNVQTYNY